MEMYYKKEGLNSFAVLPYYRETEDGYQDKLFQYHEVPHFLRYEVRQTNGTEVICYRLQYRTTIKSVIGHLPFTLNRLKNMADSMIGVLETAEEYLLEPDDILWKTENVFLEADTGKLQFCYYKGGKEFSGSLKEFLMEIMQAVDKKQEEAVLFILQFYNLVTEENCSLDELREFRNKRIGRENGIEEKEDFQRKESLSENIVFGAENIPLERDSKTDKEKRKKGNKEKEEETSTACRVVKLLLILVAAADMLLILCLIFDILTYGYMKYLFIGLAVLIILTIIYMQMTKEETPDEMMQNYFEEQKNQNGDSDTGQRIESNQYEEKSQIISEKPQKEVMNGEWGETRLLAENKRDIYAEEIVEEDEVKRLCLVPLEGSRYPKIYFDEESIVIGCMTESCNYILEEMGVSRMHAKLIPKLDGIFLIDLNSTNGTYLNGELIESGREYKLEEGDMVVFARCEFYVACE